MPSLTKSHSALSGFTILQLENSAQKEAKAKASREVSQLTRNFIEAVVLRPDYTGPDGFDKLDVDLNFQSSQFDPMYTREAFLQHLQSLRRTFPDWSCKVLDVQVTDLDLNFGGRAKIMVWEEVTGAPGDILRLGVSVYGWKRERGEWICHSIKSVKMPVPGT